MHIEIRPLEGQYVRLEPVTYEHKTGLHRALDCDEESWEIQSVNGCGHDFDGWWARLIGEKRRGERIAYAVRDKEAGRIVGTTSYLNLRPLHKGLEIGWTFLHPEARSSAVNPESKLLLLGHAFSSGAIRVEFRIDERNARSEAAVSKLGATKEGSLRRHMITWTGHVRDTAVYSIVDYDWPGVKQRLEFRLRQDFDLKP